MGVMTIQTAGAAIGDRGMKEFVVNAGNVAMAVAADFSDRPKKFRGVAKSMEFMARVAVLSFKREVIEFAFEIVKIARMAIQTSLLFLSEGDQRPGQNQYPDQTPGSGRSERNILLLKDSHLHGCRTCPDRAHEPLLSGLQVIVQKNVAGINHRFCRWAGSPIRRVQNSV